MTAPKIACVVPTCRPERINEFRRSWDDLFKRHNIRLIVVYDGEHPVVANINPAYKDPVAIVPVSALVPDELRDCFCRFTDSVRNYGFVYAAKSLEFDYVLTLDDDVAPPPAKDPIAEHLSVMHKKCSTSWLNTAQGVTPDDIPYVRGFPYSVRKEATVHLSHGVWIGVPDFDARTQLAYGDSIPKFLNFYRGPVPDLVNMPICGMNVMCSREALPLLYYAPMGDDSGFRNFHRFGDIFMGVNVLREFGDRNWAVWTGTSVVEHTRASDAHKNLVQEAAGLEAHDRWAVVGDAAHDYFLAYREKRLRYQDYLESCLANFGK